MGNCRRNVQISHVSSEKGSHVNPLSNFLSCKAQGFVHRYPRDDDLKPSLPSYYEGFALHGVTIHRLEPGFIFCSCKIAPRLTDFSGVLSAGAIANIIDDVGAAVALSDGQPFKVSVDINISYLGSANVNDEIEIEARVLGHKGAMSMTKVTLRNKHTGEIVAEGRHSLYGRPKSKL